MDEAPTTVRLQARIVGVVSDTHGHILNAQKAARMLESFDVDAVLHCGDIGSVDIPQLFRMWPTHYVLGNVDSQSQRLVEAIEAAGGCLHGRFAGLSAARRRIAMLHGDDVDRLDAEIHSGNWDLVCHGHTHLAKAFRQGDALVLNPGALYRANRLSIAVVDLDQLSATTIPIE